MVVISHLKSFKLIKINKIQIQLLGHTNHILNAKYPNVVSGYRIGLHRYRTFPLSQKTLLDNISLDTEMQLKEGGKGLEI